MYVFGRIGGEWASSQFIKLPLEMNLEAAYGLPKTDAKQVK
jgi:hypothetical protein